MKTKIYIQQGLILASFIFLFLTVSVSETHAYVTTNQEVEVLSDHAALFRIDYEFGHKSREIYMPALTSNEETTATNTLTYSIIDTNGKKVEGNVSGFVFSNAKLDTDAFYHVPKGNKKKFSLIVLFRPEVDDLGKEYRLHVDSLPFNFDGKQQLDLNPSELQYYTTKLQSL